jgi:hypothetical protein
MKKTIAAFVLLASTLACNAVAAAGLDLALSNETANLAVLFNPSTSSVNNSQISVGGVINDVDDIIFYGSIMAQGPGQYGDTYYSLGAGVKLYGGHLDGGDDGSDQTIGALAIGGRAGFYILRHPINPVDVEFEAFFAPGITSTGDTEKLWEFTGKLRVEIVRSARAYLGYRLLKVDTKDNGKLEIDDNIHLGISIDFY